MLYAVLLNPAIDHIARVAGFKPGHTFMATAVESIPAGKAMNVAYAVAALGEPVKVIGFMGSANEAFYRKFARSHKIAFDWIKGELGVRNHFTIQDNKTNATTHIRNDAFRVTAGAVELLFRKIKRSLKKNDIIAFCGSLPKGFSLKSFRRIIFASSEKGARVIIDTSGKALLEGIRGKPFGIKPNETEFEQIFGEKVNGIQHISLKSKGLVDRGIENVYVSLGEDGLLAASRSEIVRAFVKAPKPINTVGCGDAMMGGILAGLKRQLPFRDVCRIGVACATANLVSTVPGMIKLGMVKRYYSKTKSIGL